MLIGSGNGTKSRCGEKRLDTASILEGVPEGERDDNLFRLASKLRRADVPRAVTEQLILGAAAKCIPPFPANDALKKVDSAYNRYPAGNVSSFNSSISSPGSRQVPWLQPLSQAALYGLAGDIVRAIDPHTESDPAALLLQLLCGFGNMVGRRPHFRVESDFHYTNLYIAVVAETSKGRKGTSLGYLKRVLAPADFRWHIDRVQGGLSSGEGLIHAVRDPLYQKEPIKKAGKVIGYQSVMVDEGVDDKRLLVVEPEFSSTLRVMSRPGNTLSPTMRQGWDTGDLRLLTKNSPEKATGAHISVIAHTTREDLLRHLDETETANGFANRFLFTCARRSKCLARGGKIDQAVMQRLQARLDSAVNYARSVDQMDFDLQADMLWSKVYPRLSEGRPGLLGAVTSRAEAQVVRLSCIYALLDSSRVIRKEHLLAALAVWDYCEQSARWIFGESLGDATADRILSELRASPAGLARTDISGIFNHNKSASEIDRALQILVRAGLAMMQRVETDGRPSERWKYPPRYDEIDEISPSPKERGKVDMESMRRLYEQDLQDEFPHGPLRRIRLAARRTGVPTVN